MQSTYFYNCCCWWRCWGMSKGDIYMYPPTPFSKETLQINISRNGRKGYNTVLSRLRCVNNFSIFLKICAMEIEFLVHFTITASTACDIDTFFATFCPEQRSRIDSVCLKVATFS